MDSNTVYVHLGTIISTFADMGATKEELGELFEKGADLSLQDIANLEKSLYDRRKSETDLEQD